MKNSLFLLGNIGKTINHGVGKSGSYCFFSIATTRYSPSQEKLMTNWVSCVAYSNQADVIHRCCQPGSLVGLDCYVKQTKRNKSGVDYYENQVIVNEVHLCGRSKDAPRDATPVPAESLAAPEVPEMTFSDDDIPF